jgi:uncharacterized protein YjdB
MKKIKLTLLAGLMALMFQSAFPAWNWNRPADSFALYLYLFQNNNGQAVKYPEGNGNLDTWFYFYPGNRWLKFGSYRYSRLNDTDEKNGNNWLITYWTLFEGFHNFNDFGYSTLPWRDENSYINKKDEPVDIDLDLLDPIDYVGSNFFRDFTKVKRAFMKRTAGDIYIGKNAFKNSGLQMFNIYVPQYSDFDRRVWDIIYTHYYDDGCFEDTRNFDYYKFGHGAVVCNRVFKNSGLKEIQIGCGAKCTGSYVFENCTKLYKVTLEYYQAAYADGKWYDVLAPAFNFRYTAGMFRGCTSLAEISIPSYMTGWIGDYAFQGCTALKRVYNESWEAQKINANVFDGVNIEDAVLYVRNIDSYCNTDVWDDFGKITTQGMGEALQTRIIPQSVSLGDTSLYTLVEDNTLHLTAKITPQTGIISSNVTWSSSNPEVAAVSADGTVTGISPGTAVITCTTSSGARKANCTVTCVKNVRSVTVPGAAEVHTTETVVLTPEILPADAHDRQLSWISSNPSVATVINGTVLGISDGQCDITCTSISNSSASAVCCVKVTTPVVSVSLNTENTTVYRDYPFNFSLRIIPENSTVKTVKWSSGNPAVAAVSQDGTVTPLSVGETDITVTSDDGGHTATCHTRVITISPGEVRLDRYTAVIEQGRTQKLVAEIYPSIAHLKDITWSSENPDVATVSPDGTVTAVSAGETDITARAVDGGKTAKCMVIVPVPQEETVHVTHILLDISSMEVYPNEKFSIAASVYPENAANRDVLWYSSNIRTATVSPDGAVTAVSAGRAVITAMSVDGGKTQSCMVTVMPVPNYPEGISINTGSAVIDWNESPSLQLYATVFPTVATDKKILWESGNPNVAVVDQKGLVTGIADGNAEIYALTSDKSRKSTCRITVKNFPWGGGYPEVLLDACELNMNINTSRKLSATFPELIVEYVYESSNPEVAAVERDGTVTATGAGSAAITVRYFHARYGWLKSRPCTVSVTRPAEEVRINGLSEVNLSPGNSYRITATVIPQEETGRDIRFTSANPEVATVSSDGTVTAAGEGKTTVSAILWNARKNGNITVTVKRQSVENSGRADEGNLKTGIEGNVPENPVRVYCEHGKIYVNTACSERVTVCTLNGRTVEDVFKKSGEDVIDIGKRVRDRIIILKGSSGWVRKLIIIKK